MTKKSDEPARVFVGSDRSQSLAVKVLEHSIARHSTIAVEVRSMQDLVLPDPIDVRQGKRTGFSFTRFAIPELCDFQGKAVYLDADMLVFRDFRELWEIPLGGAKVIIQEEFPKQAGALGGKPRSLNKRAKQCSVMIIDNSRTRWNAAEIIKGLDGRYSYKQLMSDLCILEEHDISYDLPFEWNSLEVYEEGKTGLLHYTDMNTQPWVSPLNPLGYLWFDEVRLMLANGALTEAELRNEIDLGFFRPSLLRELTEIPLGQKATAEQISKYQELDQQAGYVMHKAVIEAQREREKAVREYEQKLKQQTSAAKLPEKNWLLAFKKLVTKR